MSELINYSRVMYSDDDDAAAAASGDSDDPVTGGDSDDPEYSYDGDSDKPGEEERPKKKHRCCLSMVITALVLVLVLCGGLLGGAYFAWDRFLGEPTQMDLFEGIRVLSNLYKADDSVVTDPYDEEDLNGFYDNVLGALCMTVDDGYNLDLPAIVIEMVNSGGLGEGGTEFALTNLNGGVSPYAAAQQAATAGEEQTTGSEALDDLLNELQFDWSSLEEVTPKTGEVELSGPQLAAFINDVLQEAFMSMDRLVEMQQEWNINFADAVVLEQVSIFAPDTINQAETCVSATIRINLKDAVSAAAEQFEGIAKFAIQAAGAILPAHIYFSASVYPCAEDGRAGVVINSTSAEDMDKMLRIVNAVLSMVGADFNTDDFLAEINATVYSAIQSVNDLIPINFVSDVVNTQPIGAVISAVGADLTPMEFFEIVRYIAAPDHYMPDSDGDGQLDGFEYVEYTSDKLIGTLEYNFGLITKDTDNPAVEGIYIDGANLYGSVMDIFAGGEGGDAILNNIDIGSIMERDIDADTATVTIDYDSIAAIIRSYLSSGEVSGVISDYGFSLLSLGYDEELSALTPADDAWITAKFKFDIRASLAEMSPELFDEDGLFYNIVNQIIPSGVYLTASLQISEIQNGGMGVEIVFNDAEYDTEGLLNSLCNLLISLGAGGDITQDLSYDGICGMISDTLSSVFTSDGGAATGLGDYVKDFDEDGLQLDNVFSLLYTVAYKNQAEEGAELVAKNEFAKAIRHIYTINGEAGGLITEDSDIIAPSAYLGRDYPASGDTFNLSTMLKGSVSISESGLSIRDIDLHDKALADVILERESTVAGGGEEGSNDLAGSLGLSDGVKYGKDYWIEQIVMLSGDNTAVLNQKEQENRVFNVVKDKYNEWRESQGMQPKNDRGGLFIVTATLSVSALGSFSEDNPVFKLLPERFTVTMIMDINLSDDQKVALAGAELEDIIGIVDENGTVIQPPKKEFESLFSVAVFINDMDWTDYNNISKILSQIPATREMAESIFGTDFNAQLREFLLRFALYENDETNENDIPDIPLYYVFICSDIDPNNDSSQLGLGYMSIHVKEFMDLAQITPHRLFPNYPGLNESTTWDDLLELVGGGETQPGGSADSGQPEEGADIPGDIGGLIPDEGVDLPGDIGGLIPDEGVDLPGDIGELIPDEGVDLPGDIGGLLSEAEEVLV